ncbi:MAG: hypothetical protein HGB19_13125 [Chlorobiales bacterium]|nr:hypothetical protein [Chlorobiales bacterium]
MPFPFVWIHAFANDYAPHDARIPTAMNRLPSQAKIDEADGSLNYYNYYDMMGAVKDFDHL